MQNNKKKIILLSVLLFSIIIVGVFIRIKNKDNSEGNKYDNKKATDKFYYVEEFVDESMWEGYGNDKIFKYNEKIARFKGAFL